MTTLDPHTQHRKLAALANFLDDLPHDRFHMPVWADEDCTETSCGSAACACGWAATKFYSEGWNFDGNHPRYGKLCDSRGFEVFFCINARDAALITVGFPEYEGMFGVYPRDITPRMAATMIRTILQRVDPAALEPEPVREAVTT